MIEVLQNQQYLIRKLNNILSFKMFNKPFCRLNIHEKNEVRIQVKARVRK